MSFHHPALVQSGELEIAQRAALSKANIAANRAGWDGEGVSFEQTKAAVAAYLAAMSEAPAQPIVVGEGDHVVVEIGGHRVEVHAGADVADGSPYVELSPDGCNLDGEMPGMYYLTALSDRAQAEHDALVKP